MPMKILCIATVSISLFLNHKVLTGFIILISKMTKVIEKHTLNVLINFHHICSNGLLKG